MAILNIEGPISAAGEGRFRKEGSTQKILISCIHCWIRRNGWMGSSSAWIRQAVPLPSLSVPALW